MDQAAMSRKVDPAEAAMKKAANEMAKKAANKKKDSGKSKKEGASEKAAADKAALEKAAAEKAAVVTPVIYTAVIDTTIAICAHLIVIMMALCFRVCRAPFAISDHFTHKSVYFCHCQQILISFIMRVQIKVLT